MKAVRFAVLATGVLLGCAMMGGQGGGGRVSGSDYVNLAEGFAFQIPGGWAEIQSNNPFRKPDWLARFEAVDGDAAVTARAADVGARSCIEAAGAVLAEQGLRALEEEPFTIATPSGDELPAWRARLEGEGRGGRVSLFCNGGRVILLEATAATGEVPARRRELERAVQSFAYAGSPTIVRVAPPPTPTPVAYFVHEIVFRGQTLGQIAKWYTGDYDNWQKLTDLNGLTKHDVPLRVGRKIRIPETLVVRRDSLPRPTPVRRVEPTAAASPTPNPTATPEVELPAVIGPR